MFLTNLFFGIDTISNRVPVYAFIFLVALGIDYNIILVSSIWKKDKNILLKRQPKLLWQVRGELFLPLALFWRQHSPLLMTQPIQLLFVFGFIVAVGILIDTFLIRGVLLPSLIVLLEKDKKKKEAYKYLKDELLQVFFDFRHKKDPHQNG